MRINRPRIALGLVDFPRNPLLFFFFFFINSSNNSSSNSLFFRPLPGLGYVPLSTSVGGLLVDSLNVEIFQGNAAAAAQCLRELKLQGG